MQFQGAPARYLQLIRKDVPLYDRVQEEVVRASADLSVLRMLDLGVGTGETSRRCLEAHAAARAVGLDASRDMLDAAAGVLASGLSCDSAASKISYPKVLSI
jgi:tRNA (cmo5U34)-methyltransferase